jgi:glyoxalase family protein
MAAEILSLHHVTATVNDAQEDLDFYCRLLGLRLVKKTVNFDNRGVYHFYYGDRTGTPGTIMTTFPYKGKGVPVGRKGAGQVTAIAFSVPPGGLDRWRSRLRSRTVSTGEGTRFGEPLIGFSDPSGLAIELIGTERGCLVPWTTSEVDEGQAIRGIHSLELTVGNPDRSLALFTTLLGFTVLEQEGNRTRIGVQGGGPGRTLDLLAAPAAAPALNGLGTVHHLALAVATPEDQLTYREAVIALGIPVTEVLDRQYFQSIYFREPGGVLLEIATVSPGFLVDESPDALGQALRLPPWEAAHRAEIEAALPAVFHP